MGLIFIFLYTTKSLHTRQFRPSTMLPSPMGGGGSSQWQQICLATAQMRSPLTPFTAQATSPLTPLILAYILYIDSCTIPTKIFIHYSSLVSTPCLVPRSCPCYPRPCLLSLSTCALVHLLHRYHGDAPELFTGEEF